MTNKENVKWLESLKKEIGKAENRTLWHYAEAIDMAIEALQAKMDGDTISRQDALKPFCVAPDGTRIPEVDCDNFPVEFSVKFIKKHLLSLPSAPDSRQRGKWVPVMDKWGAHFVCSQCGAWKYHVNQNFCGLCGADMKGKEE